MAIVGLADWLRALSLDSTRPPGLNPRQVRQGSRPRAPRPDSVSCCFRISSWLFFRSSLRHLSKSAVVREEVAAVVPTFDDNPGVAASIDPQWFVESTLLLATPP
ncbi:hypothetical protein NL676_037949 [Syzygium grande]|nr:hypothetical protein NL676_037949 [Syzygium grande]